MTREPGPSGGRGVTPPVPASSEPGLGRASTRLKGCANAAGLATYNPYGCMDHRIFGALGRSTRRDIVRRAIEANEGVEPTR